MAIFFLPIECIRTFISFPYLHLKNEDQLFELILNKIQDQRKFLFLLNYASLGNIDSFSLNYLIQSIQLTELTESSFGHFKNSLFSNYLISVDNENREDNIQSLLFSSKDIENFLIIEKENLELKSLFHTISILSDDILKVKLENHNQLNFTEEEIELAQKHTFIQIISKSIKDIAENDIIVPHHSLLIFISNSITSIGQGCFFKCEFLSQVILPISITSISDYCFLDVYRFLKLFFQIPSYQLITDAFLDAHLFLKLIFQIQLHQLVKDALLDVHCFLKLYFQIPSHQ
jgi:hypothetical protein